MFRYSQNSKLKTKLKFAILALIPFPLRFSSRIGTAMGYRMIRDLKSSIAIDTPELTGSLEELRSALANSLIDSGLYRKEALAMLETWQNSWFEEGMRVFYIVPHRFTDSRLPLKITPPATVSRVFVGRIEILSPWTQQLIETALTIGDLSALTRFDRFLDPFVSQIRNTGFVVSSAAENYLQKAYARLNRDLTAASCVP
jgi:hypothetical protein